MTDTPQDPSSSADEPATDAGDSALPAPGPADTPASEPSADVPAAEPAADAPQAAAGGDHDEDNPYPKLQVGDRQRAAVDPSNPQRRPGSLSGQGVTPLTSGAPPAEPMMPWAVDQNPKREAPWQSLAAEALPNRSTTAQAPSDSAQRSTPAVEAERPTPAQAAQEETVSEPFNASPGAGPTTPPAMADLADRIATLRAQRPEAVVGVAFVGGLILATLLKRLAKR